MTENVLIPARLQWRDDEPFSAEFGDVYFSRHQGLAESRAVFLAGNELQQRWRHAHHFTVAETGFGTGLNFLAAVEAWLGTAPARGVLDYISVEKHPLRRVDLQRALEPWRELAPWRDELLAAYPPLTPGFHLRHLYAGRVRLLLLWGEAAAMLAELEAQVDAWFLDGFAPARNPDMWSPALFQQLARLSREGSTLASFTVAGRVRRGLDAAGFEIRKVPGFGGKRENLTGRYRGEEARREEFPWFARPQPVAGQDRCAIVIGGGIAGLTSAWALWRRGWQVRLIEREPEVGRGASGNLTGLLMPRLGREFNPQIQFYLAAFSFAQSVLESWKKQTPQLPWWQSGVLELVDLQRQQAIAQQGLDVRLVQPLAMDEACRLAGVKLQAEAVLYYPLAGYLQPAVLCQALRERMAEVDFLCQREALAVVRDKSHWRVMDGGGELACAPVVIVANGFEARYLALGGDLPLTRNRGQLCYLDEALAPVCPRVPVCRGVYLTPPSQGRLCIGASYEHGVESLELDCAVQQDLLARLAEALPDFAELASLPSLAGRAAFRAGTPDRLPLAGPLPQEKAYRQQFAALAQGKTARYFQPARYQPGLMLSLGHASRGMVSSWLVAELNAALLEGTPLPVPRRVFHALHSARFWVRDLRAG